MFAKPDAGTQKLSNNSKFWLFALGAVAILTLSPRLTPTGFDIWFQAREHFDHNYTPAPKCSHASLGDTSFQMEQRYLLDLFDVADEALLFLEPGVVSGMTADVASRISFQPWPERNFVTFDIYSCGDGSPDILVERLVALFKPGRIAKTLVQSADSQYPPSDSNQVKHVDPVHFNNLPNRTAKPMPVGPNSFNAVSSTQEIITDQSESDSQILRKEDVCVNGDAPGDDCMMLKNAHILGDLQSKFQHIEVADTQSLGRCLFLDRIVQYCLPDNDVYTNNIVDRALEPFVPSAGIANSTEPTKEPISIQIVGGGDGWVASYIFDKYAEFVRSVSLVDIDPAVSEMTRKHFSPAGEVDSFIDPRVEWVYADAGKWLSETGRADSVEVVVIDCTDHNVRSSGVLYTLDFYHAVHNILKPGGRVVQQMNIEDPEYRAFMQETESLWKEAGFKNIVKWNAYIASFGGNAVFWMADA